MSGHPLQRYADVLAAAGARRLGAMTQSEADCLIGGIVTGIRHLKTKKGDRMAVFTLEDEAAAVEVVTFPEAFTRYGSLIAADAMLVVRGKYERDEESARLVTSEIMLLEGLRERSVREVEIRLSGGKLERAAMRDLAGVFERHRGEQPVSLIVELNGTTGMRIRTGTARRIRPSDHFIRDVEAICGAGSVVLK
jgi:DNA polymerase-3 subunit alpha